MPLTFPFDFNSSLASAKSEALAFLRSLIAGTAESDIPQIRERRLAASQVLRTRFLREDGSEASPRTRTESRPRNSDAERPPQKSDGKDAERANGDSLGAPGRARSAERDQCASHPSPSHHLADSPPHPPSPFEIPNLKSEILESEIPSPSSATSAGSAVNSDPIAAMTALHAELREKTRGLCGYEEKRLVKQALAALRAEQRAPT